MPTTAMMTSAGSTGEEEGGEQTSSRRGGSASCCSQKGRQRSTGPELGTEEQQKGRQKRIRTRLRALRAGCGLRE